jgi:transcriptional regulator with XRE-family HTH domain
MLVPMNRIRAIREERAALVPAAFSAVALSRRVGVSDKTLRSWEQGLSRPTARHARALARELGVTVDDLRLDDAATADVAAERRAKRLEWARQSTAAPGEPQSPPSSGRTTERRLRP